MPIFPHCAVPENFCLSGPVQVNLQSVFKNLRNRFKNFILIYLIVTALYEIKNTAIGLIITIINHDLAELPSSFVMKRAPSSDIKTVGIFNGGDKLKTKKIILLSEILKNERNKTNLICIFLFV